MPSTRETALHGLFTVLDTTLAARVERGGTRPEEVPGAGWVILRDGNPGEPEITLSPTQYHYEHLADVEVYVQGATAASRSTAIDSLLVGIGQAIDANPTLSGQVEHAMIHALDLLDDELVEGGDDIKRALVSITLFYSTSNPIL